MSNQAVAVEMLVLCQLSYYLSKFVTLKPPVAVLRRRAVVPRCAAHSAGRAACGGSSRRHPARGEGFRVLELRG